MLTMWIGDDSWDSSDLGVLFSVLLTFGSVLVVVWASRQEAHKQEHGVVVERLTNLAPHFVQCLMHVAFRRLGTRAALSRTQQRLNGSLFSPQCRQCRALVFWCVAPVSILDNQTGPQ